MKNRHLLILICISGLIYILSGCGKTESGKEEKSMLMSEINQTIDNWHKSAAQSDHAKYIGAMAKEGIYIGTDATEYWTTASFSKWSKPYFDQGKGWDLKSLKRNVYLGNNASFAWFDELLNTSMGLCRGSGVLQKANGKWQIFHYVLSPTVPNELTKEVMLLKHQQDSLIIRNLSPL